MSGSNPNPSQQQVIPGVQGLGQNSYVQNSVVGQPPLASNSASVYGSQSIPPPPTSYVPPAPPGLMTQPRPPQSAPAYNTQNALSYNTAQNYNFQNPQGPSPVNNSFSGHSLSSVKPGANTSSIPGGEPFYPVSTPRHPSLSTEKESPVFVQNGPHIENKPSSAPTSQTWNPTLGPNLNGSNVHNTGMPYVNGTSLVPGGSNLRPTLPASQMGATSTPQWPAHVRIPPPPGSSTQLNKPLQTTSVMQPPIPNYGNLQPPLRVGDGRTVPTPSLVPSSTAGLPPPYSGQKIASSSPQVTPGTSQPPSARSSRNPSPIPTQRYDFMEGQFSNKPSPSSSSTNLQTMAQSPNLGGMGQHTPTYPAVSSSSSNSYPQIPPPPPGQYGYPPKSSSLSSASQSPITAQPAQNATLPPLPPMAGSTAIRPRYPQQVGYSQSIQPSQQPLTSQPSNAPQPPSMFNSIPEQQQLMHGLPEGPVGGVAGYDPNLHAKMSGMSINTSFSRLWGNDSINLLQDRNILPPIPLEAPKPVLPQDRPNCSPDIFRCTLTKIPDTSSLLQKSRLPLGILIHPFRDISNLPVIQCNTIVRCRSCRTYINPFVTFADQRRWKCNLCFRINDLPEEFLYDPASRSYGDPARRPEIKNATMEFIAPSDYMLRPPQPSVYLFVLDVCHGATETGYLQTFCTTLKNHIDKLPGDSRTRIGFITYDGSIHFYNLGEGLNQPHMLVVSDVEDVFLPSPDNLLANLHESKALIQDLLNDLPKRFANNGDTNSCLGAALQAAYKLMAPVGGRVTVVQTCLPNYGPGALKNREDPNQRAAKEVTNIGPANDFYKKLALDCSGQQIAVDLFLLCSQYVDIATVSCISKFSAGCIHYYPGYHYQLCKLQVEKFENDLKRYITRKIGFEAVMRIRCTRGLAIHTFHGNFFVRSTDLLSLPNVNPDTGFGMQIAIEDNLTETNSVCFQSAVLYTSSNGERRIRVHTLSLPVVSLLQDVLGGADQEAIIGLVSKMAVDRSITSSLSDARDALINVCIDMLGVYKQTLQSGQVAGSLIAPYSSRLIPLFILALLKHVAFRTGISTKLDERIFAMEQMKTLPLSYLMKYIYPNLYPVHALDDKNAIHQDDDAVIPQPVILQLTYEKIDRHGAYLLDTFDTMYLYIGRAVSDHFCISILGVPNFSAIPEEMMLLPELQTPESERLRNFVSWLERQRPFHSPLKIIREDGKDRYSFLQYMLDDRTESLFSYYEFLQHLRQQVSK